MFIIFILCVCVSSACMLMCTMCVQYPWMPEEDVGSGVTGSWEAPMWMLEIEL